MTQQKDPNSLSDSIAVAQLGSAGALYKTLETVRAPYLTQAQRNASLTLPYLCPQSEGTLSTGGRTLRMKEDLVFPRNEVGPEGVKNLASKILLALWPANVHFLKFAVNEALLDQADQLEEDVGEGGEVDTSTGLPVQAGGSFRSEMQKRLIEMEKTVISRTDRLAHRKPLFELIKRLIVTGNSLLRWLDDGTLKVHNLGNYVVERDYKGRAYRVILKEVIQLSLLDEATRERVLAVQPDLKDKADATAELYTYWGAQDSSEMWETWQEVTPNGIVVPDSYGTYRADDIPVSPQRWVAVDGEDYGISLIEEHYESLADLEQLQIDVSETSKAAARIVPLVNPTGMTEVADINKAGNLEFVAGREEDITILGIMDKIRDYQAATQKIDRLIAHFQRIFLMYQAAQRDAERVTAEEVRYIAMQLEQAHGGVYTVLADELQKPYVNRMIRQAIAEGDLEKELFDDGDVRPNVITGLDAIGRGQDVEALDEIFGLIGQYPTLEAEFNMTELITRRLIARGVELDGLLKSPQQKLAEQQAAMAMQKNEMADGVEAGMIENEHAAALAEPAVE